MKVILKPIVLYNMHLNKNKKEIHVYSNIFIPKTALLDSITTILQIVQKENKPLA